MKTEPKYFYLVYNETRDVLVGKLTNRAEAYEKAEAEAKADIESVIVVLMPEQAFRAAAKVENVYFQFT